MRADLVAEQMITVGEPVVVEAPSPKSRYSVVFEDDGDTAYLYGLDHSQKKDPIVDALHIYDAENVTDRSILSKLQLVWSKDGVKAALLINGYPHAIFNFKDQRGYCRTGFPSPSKTWSAEGHAWDDEALELFR
jgi:hypothetical protein